MMHIMIGYMAAVLELGVLIRIYWDMERYPHMLLFGSTGSGKTYLLKLILGRIGLHLSGSEIVLCDFKGDNDFISIHGSYRFSDCQKGLDRAMEQLRARQADPSVSRHCFLFVFDEWSAFLGSLDKKAAEKAKNDLASLLMLGRSFGIHVIISQQRVDARYFDNARDNFSFVIGMGRLSKESVQMMFSDVKEELNPCKGRGHGSVLAGSALYDLVVPAITNEAKLQYYIQSGVSRYARLTLPDSGGAAGEADSSTADVRPMKRG